jgi:hypothetical protein
VPPAGTEEPKGPPPEGRPGAGFTFPGETTGGTAAERARAHADRLLASPDDARLRGYPESVVARADAQVATDNGHRPVVLLFYDDTARASNLQAAEFLPVLAKYAGLVDVVAVDVAASAKWTPAERKLVRNYYVAYVPTTVVLAPDRSKPLMIKYQRIGGAVLDAVLERETRR